jgi:hypothetical protein
MSVFADYLAHPTWAKPALHVQLGRLPKNNEGNP